MIQQGRDHRPVHPPELRSHRFDLPPPLERPLLLRPPRRVRDAARGRVVVEQSPGDRAVENCRSACVASKRCPSGTLNRHAYTSRGDRSASRFSPSPAVALPLGAATFEPVPVRPQPLAVVTLRLQLEHASSPQRPGSGPRNCSDLSSATSTVKPASSTSAAPTRTAGSSTPRPG
jgi:hypothetical protein